MDIGIERSEAGATIGTLFQHIVNDMKNSSPLWEDFIAKATKLHACLRAAIQALAAYLEAFQKIADSATNSKGATKEIGTALTRVCLRHKAVETRMKTFTAAIMDCLIVPLQEKLEDWRKHVAIIDKDHAKEYKRCRTELKKRSSDTLRLQKKAKKGQADNLHILVESSMQDVTLRRTELEEVERKSLRAIMVEERSRYCTFVNMLQPVVHEECEVMSELSHLQEAMQLIAIVTKDPSILPQASEELILESKTNINFYPDSPGGSNSQGGCSNSLGSRKSSVCSISSMNSSSSGSPGHQFQRSLSQYSPAIRLKPGESSDSGFCSSPALTSQASTLASQSHAVSTWPPHTQDNASSADRPHTISSAYEKGHQRPALTVYTFQNPETISENQKSPANISCRPPLPVRCSSLERPLSTASMKNANTNAPRQCPSPIPAHITKEHPQLQPTYVNMTELASMAASKVTNNNHNNNTTNQSPSVIQTPIQPQTIGYQQLQQPNSPVLSSASSLISPDSCATNAISSPDVSACSTQTPQNTPQTESPQTPIYSGSAMSVVGSGSGNGESVVDGSVPTSPKHVATTIETESNNDNNKHLSSSAPNDLDDNPSIQDNTNNQSQFTTDKDILKCTGSVLEKTSMFEQQINNNQHQQQVLLNTPTRVENVYGHKGEEIYKTTGLHPDRDAGASRVARRSSVNTIKPPPPVRRSSSVTPNPNMGTSSPNLSQQSHAYTSSESLPPPPAYLLDSTAGNSPIPGNVAGTVKALNEIRHKPASPSVLRRAHQNLSNQQQPLSQYSTNVYNTSPPKNEPCRYASPSNTQHLPLNTANSVGDSPNLSANRASKSSHHQQGIYAQPKQITTMSSFRTTSPGPQKQNSGFLAQLNARITPSKTQQQQSSPQHYQSQQQSYTYTTAPSNEPVYHRSSPADQRSSYNISNQQQQTSQGIYSTSPQQTSAHQQQSQYYYHQQVQSHQQHSTSNSQRDGKAQIYSSAPSQNQQPHHHHSKQQQTLQQPQTKTQFYYQQTQPQQTFATQNIYVSTNPFATASPVHSSYSPSSFGKSPRDGHDSGHGGGTHSRSNQQLRGNIVGNANNTNNVLAKTSAGFLENLNARLAEQRLSGKAFAVRNLINSKALPDPRICHESLMDQIKRGATLKRNRTINDRSAPKIH
ncbi:immunoglobulin A1 protease autotransporter isoform X12 [Malaya genurostris]|uniref:immunoglobulin A1 protease autotransporter isoform X12 n=1 Tax=Malaya genurostris TaxID=325434 RepID=UPI0026F3E443|nr:immunoglobulin A1 protease autotransporter isoform X12 [Malaya genurostris]